MSVVVGWRWLVVVVAAAPAVVGLWRWADRVAARDRTGSLSSRARRSSVVSRWLEPRLAACGVGASAREVLQVWSASTFGAVVVAASFDVRFVLPVSVVGLVGGPCWLRVRRNRHALAVSRALPDGLRGIAAELRVGGTVHSGLATLAASTTPLAAGAAAVCRRCELGSDLETALDRWAGELGSASAHAMAGALALAVHVGGPAAAALDGLASSLSEQFDAQAELRAQSAQARASALVMVVAPLGYLAFAATIDQHGLDVLFGTVIGRVCLVTGLVLDALAWWWIRVLVRDRFAR